jgi:Zn-dependent M32 family carboxypeptidase
VSRIQKKLAYFDSFLEASQKLNNISCLLAFDRETICPKDAMDEHSELEAYISNQNFKKFKDKKFAAKCDRETIKKGCEMLGMEVAEVAEICIEGMKAHAEEIGLGGTL